MRKIAILIIVGIVLVLSAAFLYINNDLSVSKARKVVNDSNKVETIDTAGSGQRDKSTDITSEEASLDTVFGVEEPTDNFDDIVI